MSSFAFPIDVSMHTVTQGLLLIGGATAVLTALNILSFIWMYMLRPSSLRRYLHPSPTGQPPWALVTGASDGIGRALAHQLAAQGFNVVIHGRNPAKTAAVLAALETAHPARQFRSFLFDGQRTTPDSLAAAVQATGLSDLHLTVLINNAGASMRPSFGPLWSYAPADIAATLALNAHLPLLLTRALLPQLLEARRALVVFVGSLSDNGLPLLVGYGSCKTGMMGAARSLGRELAMEGHGGVEVLGMRVGEVTGVSNIKVVAGWGIPDAVVMAAAMLASVGCGRGVVIPYWQHALQQVGVDLVPEVLLERIYRVVIGKKRMEEQTTGKYS